MLNYDIEDVFIICNPIMTNIHITNRLVLIDGYPLIPRYPDNIVLPANSNHISTE